MSDAIEPTTDDTEGTEVEAHAASPLELQDLGVSDADKGTEGLLAGSTVSLAACA